MNVLLVFLKAPVPGQVKTRLASALGPAQACAVYKEMAREVYRAAAALPEVRLRVAYAPHPDHPDLSWLEARHPKEFLVQEGQDLGSRLARAFARAFKGGAGRVIAIGSDSPGLPGDWIARGFEALEHCDVALGPAEDGGYYLIGLREPRPELFADIPWSGPDTFKATLLRVEELGLRVHILPKYFDVDDLETLRRWRNGAKNVVSSVTERRTTDDRA